MYILSNITCCTNIKNIKYMYSYIAIQVYIYILEINVLIMFSMAFNNKLKGLCLYEWCKLLK